MILDDVAEGDEEGAGALDLWNQQHEWSIRGADRLVAVNGAFSNKATELKKWMSAAMGRAKPNPPEHPDGETVRVHLLFWRPMVMTRTRRTLVHSIVPGYMNSGIVVLNHMIEMMGTTIDEVVSLLHAQKSGFLPLALNAIDVLASAR